jgi:hypothetical protein
MDNLNELFEQATDGGDVDTEIAAAGELLQKIAAEQNINLDELSADDVAELIVELMPQVKQAQAQAGQPAAASVPNQITHADVAAEMGKLAAAEGVDLGSLSRPEYHDLYDRVAQYLTSPEAQAEKVAEDEARAKLAEADTLGRVMARAFMDEQEKIALTEDEKTYHRERMRKNVAKPSEMNPARHTAAGASKAKAEERLARIKSKNSPMAHLKALGEKARYNAAQGKSALTAAVKANPRAAAAIGAGSVLTAGKTAYGGKKLLDRRDKSAIDDAAFELAREYLRENGVDPDTGDKVASDAVAARAAELLRDAGWID